MNTDLDGFSGCSHVPARHLRIANCDLDGVLTFEAASVWQAAPRLQRLLLLDDREVRFVPSVFHLVDGDEMKSGGVNDISLARG